MSNALAIASVTAVLKDVLSNGMKAMKVGDIADAVQSASGGDYEFGLVPMPANDVVVALDFSPGNRTAFDAAVKTMGTVGSNGGGIAYDEALDTVLNHLAPRTG